MEGYGDKWRILSWDTAVGNAAKVPTASVAGQSRAERFADVQTKLQAASNKRKLFCSDVITNKCKFILNIFSHMLFFTSVFRWLL
jgi:hypothetical protein